MKLSVSYIRVIAMLLVVLIHCYDLYGSAWNTCNLVPFYDCFSSMFNYIHLPLFFMISGYLYQKGIKKYQGDGYNVFVYKKLKRLMLPYMFWGIVIVLVSSHVWLELLSGIGHLWFLMTLFVIFLLVHALYPVVENSILKAQKENKLMLLVITLGFVWLIMYILSMLNGRYSSFGDLFCLGRALVNLPYFLLGMLMSRESVLRAMTRIKWGGVISVFIMCCIQYLHWKGYPVIRHYSFYNLIMTSISLFYCAYFFKFFTYREMELEKRKKTSAFVETLASYSMGIYILHLIIIDRIMTLPTLIDFANNNIVIFPIILFSIITMVSALLTMIGKKFKLLNLVLG